LKVSGNAQALDLSLVVEPFQEKAGDAGHDGGIRPNAFREADGLTAGFVRYRPGLREYRRQQARY